MAQEDVIQCRELRTVKFIMGENHTPVSPNVFATGTGKTVDNVITELQRLGLVTQT